MDAITAITERHSTRNYRPEPIPREILEKIVDAGRLAASGRNDQPWEFVVLTERATVREIGMMTDRGQFIAEAAACIVVLCRPTMYYLEDGAAATQNMLVAAAALGVGSCWVSGDKRPYAEAVVKRVDAPSDMKLVSLISLGYEGTPSERRPKRTLRDVLHWEKF